MAEPVRDPVLQWIFDLIKAKNQGLFKAFYYGDPVKVPASSTPALIGARRMSNQRQFTNKEDIGEIAIMLTVISDIRADIQDDKTLVAGWSRLYDIIEGRDPSTYILKPESLLSIVRHNQDNQQNGQFFLDVANPTKVDYGMVVNKRTQPGWSLEATISTVVSIVQFR